MKKPDVVRLFRQKADPALMSLGFRWRRMVGCTAGHYVRDWDGGRDTVGFGLASYHPVYHLRGYATVRLDAVAALLLPHAGLVSREYEADFFVCHVGFAAFLNGPGGNRNHHWDVSTPEEVAVAADEYLTLVRDRAEPWLRTMRTLTGLSRLPEEWRSVSFGHNRGMVEIALAFLCEPPEEAERVFGRQLAEVERLNELERGRLRSLVTDLRARLTNPS